VFSPSVVVELNVAETETWISCYLTIYNSSAEERSFMGQAAQLRRLYPQMLPTPYCEVLVWDTVERVT
jgi:hypothetical protein